MARILVKHFGIPANRTVVEGWSDDTIGNAYAARVMHTEWAHMRDIVVVTSEFQLERTRSVGRSVGRSFTARFRRANAMWLRCTTTFVQSNLFVDVLAAATAHGKRVSADLCRSAGRWSHASARARGKSQPRGGKPRAAQSMHRCQAKRC